MVVSDVVLIPTDHGPALEIPANVAKLRVFRAIVIRFGGRIGEVESPGADSDAGSPRANEPVLVDSNVLLDVPRMIRSATGHAPHCSELATKPSS